MPVLEWACEAFVWWRGRSARLALVHVCSSLKSNAVCHMLGKGESSPANCRIDAGLDARNLLISLSGCQINIWQLKKKKKTSLFYLFFLFLKTCLTALQPTVQAQGSGEHLISCLALRAVICPCQPCRCWGPSVPPPSSTCRHMWHGPPVPAAGREVGAPCTIRLLDSFFFFFW